MRCFAYHGWGVGALLHMIALYRTCCGGLHRVLSPHMRARDSVAKQIICSERAKNFEDVCWNNSNVASPLSRSLSAFHGHSHPLQVDQDLMLCTITPEIARFQDKLQFKAVIFSDSLPELTSKELKSLPKGETRKKKEWKRIAQNQNQNPKSAPACAAWDGGVRSRANI